MEKVVKSQLLDHLKTNAFWPRFQSAYRARHSAETTLLRVLNDLLTASDDSQVSLLTLLDLSTASDTIDHSILFHRLEHAYGIQKSPLSFFPSYLTERQQTVSISCYSSNHSTLCYGVPQSSGLGPYCFFRTHNHSHRSLTDTQFPIVNLPMVTSCTIQRHVNIFAL